MNDDRRRELHSLSELTDWLREQIAEDERQCGPADEHGLAFCDAEEGVHYTAARVRAECKAKRRIIELHQVSDGNPYFDGRHVSSGTRT